MQKEQEDDDEQKKNWNLTTQKEANEIKMNETNGRTDGRRSAEKNININCKRGEEKLKAWHTKACYIFID